VSVTTTQDLHLSSFSIVHSTVTLRSYIL